MWITYNLRPITTNDNKTKYNNIFKRTMHNKTTYDDILYTGWIVARFTKYGKKRSPNMILLTGTIKS